MIDTNVNEVHIIMLYKFYDIIFNTKIIAFILVIFLIHMIETFSDFSIYT
jgi:xanthine/uracil permease